MAELCCLTARERRVLTCIKQHMAVHGYAPSVREMMDGAGVTSTSLIAYYLQRLEHYGFIKMTPRLARSIVLVGEVPKVDVGPDNGQTLWETKEDVPEG